MSLRKVQLMALAVATLVGLVAFAVTAAAQQRGDPAAGKTFWDGQLCSRCHGVAGEGGFGPDLAGRGLTVNQFKRAIRTPWGIMPAYTTQQVSDQNIADLQAYFNSLPAVAEPGPWRVAIPAGAKEAQKLFISNGCAQCHGATADGVRRGLGNEGVTDPDHLWEMVFEHTKEFPTGRMGNFNELRFQGKKQIWDWLSKDLGLRVTVAVTVTAGALPGDRTAYTVDLENRGALDAGQVYIAALIPPGSTLVGTPNTPAGALFRGVEGTPAGAAWVATKIPAKGKLGPFTFEVQGPGAGTGSHAWVRWLSPTPGGDFVISGHVEEPEG